MIHSPDRFIFVVKTENKSDLKFINQLVQTYPKDYSIQPISSGDGFSQHYTWIPKQQLFIKIDDDILFIRKGALEAMLTEYLTQKWLIVSANVINHPLLSFVHGRLGALLTLNNTFQLEHSAASQLEYNSGGECSWKSGDCAYQQHYSFYQHYLKSELDVYDFKRWDFHAYVCLIIFRIFFFIFYEKKINHSSYFIGLCTFFD